jgi:hypothetical protein
VKNHWSNSVLTRTRASAKDCVSRMSELTMHDTSAPAVFIACMWVRVQHVYACMRCMCRRVSDVINECKTHSCF